MLKEKPRFAVLGTGNSGQTFAADITLKGYPVNLAEVPEFEGTLRAIEKKGGIEISGEAGNGFAVPHMLTTDIGKALRGVDVIIVGGSAFAHEPLVRMAAPHFEDGQFILFTSNFAALRFRKWKKEIPIAADVTPVEAMSLIYATRALEPGKVAVIGLKGQLPVAALPASRTEAFLKIMAPVFPQMKPAQNALVTSLNNLNPIVHPPMILFNAGRIESTGGIGWNIYGDGATESVTKVMLSMDAERMSIMARLGLSGTAFKDAFEALYANYSLGGRQLSLSQALRKSPIHSNPAFPAPPTIDSRYLTEDVPFGLVPWSSIGKMWGIPTPTVDALLRVASVMMDRDYDQEGITIGDLGIAGMTPDELLASVA